MGVKRQPLGDLCHIATGGTPARSESAYFGGGIPWVKISDLLQGVVTATDETISRAGLENSAAKLLPKGTVLISVFATIGRTALLGIEAATNQAIAGVTPKSGSELDARFLKHFFDASKQQLEGLARGVAQPNINLGILRSLEIPLPPLPEQRRIAAILDKADALRTQRREALAQLDRLAQAIFVEMFGDPVENTFNWDVFPLEKISSKITDGTHKTPTYTNSGIEFISAKDIKNDRIFWGTNKFISETEHAQLSKRCNPEIGDLVLAKSGSLGSVAIIDRDHEFSLFESLCLIKTDKTKVEAEFLASLLRNSSMQSHILGKNKGIAIKHLHLIDIRELIIALPPLKLQKIFITRIQAVEYLKATHRTALTELDALFASLQHRAFRGEL
jgi:type I restriction enzyme S subunit